MRSALNPLRRHRSPAATHRVSCRDLAARMFAFLALCLIGSGALAGKANNTLNVAFPREVVTLDGLYSNLRENDILSLVTDDTLFTVDPQTLQPIPLV